MIVLAATINPDLSSVTGTKFGQPMAQIYYDAVGKNGTLGLMSLLFIVQFLMGLSILVAGEYLFYSIFSGTRLHHTS